MAMRQGVLGLMFAAATALLSPVASADTIKIGFITSYSGFLGRGRRGAGAAR